MHALAHTPASNAVLSTATWESQEAQRGDVACLMSPSKAKAQTTLRHHVDLPSRGLTGRGFRRLPGVALVGRAQMSGLLGAVGGWDLMKLVPPPLLPHLHSGSSGAAASPWMPWD